MRPVTKAKPFFASSLKDKQLSHEVQLVFECVAETTTTSKRFSNARKDTYARAS